MAAHHPRAGRGGDILYDAFLPEAYREQFPFLYPDIVPWVREHMRLFPFRVHLYFNHMASSQAANLNLFLPILLHPRAAEVLRAVKPDIARLATDRLYHGFCVEYWDGVEGEKKRMYRGIKYKGLLNDKKGTTGTDADIAIAYYNPQNELCLWLVEHKLCEAEFTSCGGYRSPRNQGKHRCANHFSDILANKELCHYHSYNQYNYWRITEANPGFFANHAPFPGCPFRGGLNQLWRNQLLGLSIEQDQSLPYKHVSFSVVHHPRNHQLDHSIQSYKALIAHNPKFSTFPSTRLVQSARDLHDAELGQWAEWYGELYNV